MTPTDPAGSSPRSARGAQATVPGAAGPSHPPEGPAGNTPAGEGQRRAAGASPAGLQAAPRTYTIALPAGMKLLSLNDRLHFGARYRRSQDLKKAACVMALKARIPRLERVSVVVEYQPRDRRERDPDNISPSGKAALDGIVAAKILADDSKTYVTGVRCVIGDPFPGGRLVLHLTEETA